MRITSKMLSRQVINNLNNVYDKLSKEHMRAATGDAFQRASENPYDAIRGMNIRDRLGRIGQYERNIETANGTVLECETALTFVNKGIDKVINELRKASSGTYNNEDKANMAQVVKNKREEIIDLLNKDFGGKYVFGGYNSYASPMKMKNGKLHYNNVDISTMTDAKFNEMSNESLVVKTGSGTSMDIAMPGITITGYGEDNLIGLLDKVNDCLLNNASSDELNVLQEKLENRKNLIQNSISKLGGRTTRIETMTNQIASSRNNLEKLQSSVEGVDEEKALIDFKMTEMVYNAALSIGSSLIQPTLVDFLR